MSIYKNNYLLDLNVSMLSISVLVSVPEHFYRLPDEARCLAGNPSSWIYVLSLWFSHACFGVFAVKRSRNGVNIRAYCTLHWESIDWLRCITVTSFLGRIWSNRHWLLSRYRSRDKGHGEYFERTKNSWSPRCYHNRKCNSTTFLAKFFAWWRRFELIMEHHDKLLIQIQLTNVKFWWNEDKTKTSKFKNKVSYELLITYHIDYRIWYRMYMISLSIAFKEHIIKNCLPLISMLESLNDCHIDVHDLMTLWILYELKKVERSKSSFSSSTTRKIYL